MSFTVVDVVVESVLRDGIANLRAKPEIIEDVFSSLTQSFASKKYGVGELDKIKDLISKKEINIVHSFHETNKQEPCFSIQLGADNENTRQAHLDDAEGLVTEVLTDPTEIANLTRISSVTVSAYDSNSGKLSIDDSVNLTNVYANLIFVDADGVEFTILGGIDNTIGQKSIFIAPNATVNIAIPGSIKSGLNYKRFELRGVIHDVKLLIGVHSKDPLTTKYLYILLKYLLLSRKADLESRCFNLTGLQGSDFTRDLAHLGDHLFTRFLTVSGRIEDQWNADQVDLIDNVEVQVLVEKDEQTDETLGRTDQSVQIVDD